MPHIQRCNLQFYRQKTNLAKFLARFQWGIFYSFSLCVSPFVYFSFSFISAAVTIILLVLPFRPFIFGYWMQRSLLSFPWSTLLSHSSHLYIGCMYCFLFASSWWKLGTPEPQKLNVIQVPSSA